MVPHPDALTVSIFRDQTGHTHQVIDLDIGEIAVVTIQENAHRTTAIVDEEVVVHQSLLVTVPVITASQPWFSSREAWWVVIGKGVGSPVLGLDHLHHFGFEEFDLGVAVVDVDGANHTHFRAAGVAGWDRYRRQVHGR